mmetsp:Transcript_18223/g.32667  ORF Transcript_18223/g.32667 Transcript_18223/m.32667 type:complete len:195 (-) Transcript_18223:897-1481(-)
MKGVVLLLAFVASINAFSGWEADQEMEFIKALEFTALAAKNFTEGLAIGMQKTEKPLSKCYNSTVKAEASINAVAQTAVKCAFLHLDQCAALSAVYDQIAVKYQVVSVDCKLNVLEQKFKELEQPAAYSQITWRFFMYQKVLTQKTKEAVQAIEANNYFLAGKNFGYVIRVLFDFTVSSEMEIDYVENVSVVNA